MNEAPALRVVRGKPTAEELAVLTALAAAANAKPHEAPAPKRGRWNDPAHSLQRPLFPAPGAWRAGLG